ncbi:hypothetical protein O3M35_004295 [Rhynocoris fuscipes]|uniref:Uncharacterized protein n=1 Tax=Rhynocoris fuscipes TaxID=488301 RepID=A0AAW1CGZ3_9HEMI
MGIIDNLKKWKRLIESYLLYRRSYLFILLVILFIFYLCPSFNNVFLKRSPIEIDTTERCLDDHLTPFYAELEEGNANIRHLDFDKIWENPEIKDDSYLPFIGNGHIGLSVLPKSSLFIKYPNSRTLTIPVGWSPLISPISDGRRKEAVVTHYPSGVVSRFQCYSSGLYLSHHIYSHRSRKQILIQELKIANPTSKPISLNLNVQSAIIDKFSNNAEHKIIRLKDRSSDFTHYNLFSTQVNDDSKADENIGICALMKNLPSRVMIEPHRTINVFVPAVIYTEIIKKDTFLNQKSFIEGKCMEIMKNITNLNSVNLKQDHIDAWFKVWSTGLYISKSKAAGALNGDKINATIYYVLSNVLLEPSHQLINNSSSLKAYNSLAEGCYGGYHHTLQARNLWKSLNTFEEVNEIVALWFLTLEKQGCHKLIKTGAIGVSQAMLLSFGGFKFSAHHLEFKIDPKFLHRDYAFRRIHYNEMTYINISVTLQDDNKAQLAVALDKSDRPYYACDGGCNTEPVQLGNTISYFPVKLTDPITSILYITPDRDHIELIKDTLHVHNVVEAPAYDHHVIALHRHGHHLGGLPTIFWASVCFLIIIFHLFLFKLIFNEYCDKQDNVTHRNRYNKL